MAKNPVSTLHNPSNTFRVGEVICFFNRMWMRIISSITNLCVPGTWQCAAGSSAGWPWRPPGWNLISSAGPLFSKLCRRRRPVLWICSAAAGRLGLRIGSAPLPSYTAHLETPEEPGQSEHTSESIKPFIHLKVKSKSVCIWQKCILFGL